jgi:hypothetical protein
MAKTSQLPYIIYWNSQELELELWAIIHVELLSKLLKPQQVIQQKLYFIWSGEQDITFLIQDLL